MFLFVNYPSFITPYVIKGLPIRWYAVMYIFAFVTAYLLYKSEIKRGLPKGVKKENMDNLFIWVIIGLLLGARIGSCLFYDDAVYYLTHPWMIFWPFRNGKFVGLPGMSYHGGVIGGVLAGSIYSRVKKMSILESGDWITSVIPFAYTWGRLGNFFNAELYGRVTSSPLGMLFPDAEVFPTSLSWVNEIANKCGLDTSSSFVNLPRWPSQLFEALFEGLVLGSILWFVLRPLKRKEKIPSGTIFGSYILGYGLFRFFIEYFRQPDSDIGYVLSFGKKSENIYLFESMGNISKGQVFCFIMVLIGIAVIVASFILDKKRRKIENDQKKSRSIKKRNA